MFGDNSGTHVSLSSFSCGVFSFFTMSNNITSSTRDSITGVSTYFGIFLTSNLDKKSACLFLCPGRNSILAPKPDIFVAHLCNLAFLLSAL